MGRRCARAARNEARAEDEGRAKVVHSLIKAARTTRVNASPRVPSVFHARENGGAPVSARHAHQRTIDDVRKRSRSLELSAMFRGEVAPFAHTGMTQTPGVSGAKQLVPQGHTLGLEQKAGSAQSRFSQQPDGVSSLQTPEMQWALSPQSSSATQQPMPSGTHFPGESKRSQSAAHPHTNAPEQISPPAHSSSRQHASGCGALQRVPTHM